MKSQDSRTVSQPPMWRCNWARYRPCLTQRTMWVLCHHRCQLQRTNSRSTKGELLVMALTKVNYKTAASLSICKRLKIGCGRLVRQPWWMIVHSSMETSSRQLRSNSLIGSLTSQQIQRKAWAQRRKSLSNHWMMTCMNRLEESMVKQRTLPYRWTKLVIHCQIRSSL